MAKHLYINFNTLNLSYPTALKEKLSQPITGRNILCLILERLGYKVNGGSMIEDVPPAYQAIFEDIVAGAVIGIPSSAIVSVIPIGLTNYLLTFEY